MYQYLGPEVYFFRFFFFFSIFKKILYNETLKFWQGFHKTGTLLLALIIGSHEYKSLKRSADELSTGDMSLFSLLVTITRWFITYVMHGHPEYRTSAPILWNSLDQNLKMSNCYAFLKSTENYLISQKRNCFLLLCTCIFSLLKNYLSAYYRSTILYFV